MSTINILDQHEGAILGLRRLETTSGGPSASSSLEGVHRFLFCLLALRRWPDIARLSDEEMIDVTRICALLSLRATAGVSLARILDIPKDRVQSALRLLHEQDCLDVHAQHTAPPALRTPGSGDALASSMDDDVPGIPENSFVRKIWQRLASRK